MSLYFTSCSGSSINTMTGLRSIVTKHDIKSAVESNVIDRIKSGTDASTAYYEAIKSITDGELPEEFDHFCCLSKSYVVRILHFYNIIARYGYAELTRKTADWRTVSQHKFIKRIASYNFLYNDFYYIAAPLIEAHYRIQKKSAEDHPRADFFVEGKVEIAEKFLLSTLGDGSSRYCPDKVGRLIDIICFDRDNQNYDRILPCDISVPIHIVKSDFFKEFFSTALSRQLYPNVPLVVLRNFRVIFKHYLGAIKTSSGRERRASLPMLWANDGVIDPFGIKSDRLDVIGSQEPPYKKDRDLACARVLWHIINRVCMIISCIRHDKNISICYEYLSSLRRFFARWAPAYDLNLQFVYEVDCFVLEYMDSKKEDKNLMKSTTELCTIALPYISECFQHFLDEWPETVWNERKYCIPDTFGFSYMHI